jgi:hypothetical protein
MAAHRPYIDGAWAHAADVAITTTFGPSILKSFKV